ncbi:hypothetical protein IJD44_07135 [bacterium]|nr:hypothetical protein [bacterium]
MNDKMLLIVIFLLIVGIFYSIATPSSGDKSQLVKDPSKVRQERKIQPRQSSANRNTTRVARTQEQNHYKRDDGLSQSEIRRREQAVFDNLKTQQYNELQRQRSISYNARMNANTNQQYNNNQNSSLDDYLLNNIALDVPPSGQQMQQGTMATRDFYIEQNLKQGDRTIPINQPTALSYKSKQEIFDIRKHYVSQSLFSYPNYEPAKEPFGQIENSLPWISTNYCRGKDQHHSNVDGLSEESRFLNNPSILVGIDWPYSPHDENCNAERDIIMPSSARYIKDEKLIEVTYNGLPFKHNDDSPYELNGLNARDFGYQYAMLDPDKSENSLMFVNFNSIASEVVEFRNFIHRGNSCGVEGGCNNGSPHQPMLNFTYKFPDMKVVMYIKLWRKKPKLYTEEADINQKIIILPKG